MKQKSNAREGLESVRRHYLIERELADLLRSASADDRKGLYRTVYNELFLRVPEHGQNTRKQDASALEARVKRQMRLLRRFLRPDAVYLEVGAGDCYLAMTIARQVRHVYAVDVSDVIAGSIPRPPNFDLIISDGIAIDVPPASVQVAYSHMLLEHLHPDDAVLQLREVYKSIAPGGVYICITQHSVSGPHDVSKYFDPVATGFHLKEYTYREIMSLFRSVGFKSITVWARIKGRYLKVPRAGVLGIEVVLKRLPVRVQKFLARRLPLRLLFEDLIAIGHKGPKD